MMSSQMTSFFKVKNTIGLPKKREKISSDVIIIPTLLVMISESGSSKESPLMLSLFISDWIFHLPSISGVSSCVEKWWFGVHGYALLEGVISLLLSIL